MDEPAVDPALPSRALDEVLSRPEFGGPQPTQPPGWLTRFVDWLGDALAALPSWTDEAILIVLGLLALLLVIALLRDGGLGARPPSTDADPAQDDASRPRVPAAEWNRRGREAMAAGRHSEAVVFLFRAIVAHLAESGILHDDPSRTNREHRRDLRRRPAEAEAFDRAVPSFERVRYGRRDATEEEARLVAASAAAVLGETP